MATDNIKYRFIQNVGDYFPAGYFSEDFIDKVQKTSGVSAEDMGKMCEPYIKLRGEYEKYKNYIINTHPRTKDAIRHTHDFNTRLLTVLGYDTSAPYDQFVTIDEDNHCVVPVRHVLTRNGQTTMLVMEMQHLIKTGEQEPAGLYEQQYNVEGGGADHPSPAILRRTMERGVHPAERLPHITSRHQQSHRCPLLVAGGAPSALYPHDGRQYRLPLQWCG